MLAEHVARTIQTGILASDVHLPSTSKYQLLDFISCELPRWRDHPDRPKAVSETLLSEHLCDHLTGAARLSDSWDFIQFRTETADEQNKARKIDLSIKPSGVGVVIEGRRYSQFESIMPIECKRLPTPKATDRDEREYVVVRDGTTGGIQRFKFGNHGGAHDIAAMIGYVQEFDAPHWNSQIDSWIDEMVATDSDSWSASEHLTMTEQGGSDKTTRLRSCHGRVGGRASIELHHLWLRMN